MKVLTRQWPRNKWQSCKQNFWHICNGQYMMVKSANDEDELSIMCPVCTHLWKNCLNPECCQSCDEQLKKGECNPCHKCEIHWLINNNSIKSHLEQAKERAQSKHQSANSKQEDHWPAKRQRTEVNGNDENTSPMTLNKMAHAVTFTNMLMIPVGKKLTAMQQWKKTCCEIRLPIKQF
jgi:hypothetical protein